MIGLAILYEWSPDRFVVDVVLGVQVPLLCLLCCLLFIIVCLSELGPTNCMTYVIDVIQ